MKRIIMGADHAGYDLKEALKSHLSKEGWEVVDQGTFSHDPVDYADFGGLVALAVATGAFSRGILVCGSGVGMTILANKFPGVRAVLALDLDMACLSRVHNNTNILALAGRRTDAQTAAAIVDGWLATPFEGGRHELRLDKIRQWEQKIFQHQLQEEQP